MGSTGDHRNTHLKSKALFTHVSVFTCSLSKPFRGNFGPLKSELYFSVCIYTGNPVVFFFRGVEVSFLLDIIFGLRHFFTQPYLPKQRQINGRHEQNSAGVNLSWWTLPRVSINTQLLSDGTEDETRRMALSCVSSALYSSVVIRSNSALLHIYRI